METFGLNFYRASCLSKQLGIQETVTLVEELCAQWRESMEKQKEKERLYYISSGTIPGILFESEKGKNFETHPQSLEDFVLEKSQKGDRVDIYMYSSVALVEIYQENSKPFSLFGRSFRGRVYAVGVLRVNRFLFLAELNPAEILPTKDEDPKGEFEKLFLEEWAYKKWTSLLGEEDPQPLLGEVLEPPQIQDKVR